MNSLGKTLKKWLCVPVLFILGIVLVFVAYRFLGLKDTISISPNQTNVAEFKPTLGESGNLYTWPSIPLVSAEEAMVAWAPVAERIDAFCLKNGFQPRKHELSALPDGTKEDRQGKYITLGNPQTSVELELSIPRGNVVSFRDHATMKIHDQEILDVPEQSTWSKEKAVVIGKEFVGSILGYFPENLRLSSKTAYRTPLGRMDGKYYRKYWIIIWTRLSDDGYPFHWDHLWIMLSETHGPFGFDIQFPTRYAPSTHADEKPISEEEARRLAEEQTATVMSYPLIQEYSQGCSLGKQTSAELMIAVPNHDAMVTGDLREEDCPGAAAEGKLIWRVCYEVCRDIKENQKTGVPAPIGYVWVWLDAFDGTLQGGDNQIGL